MSRALFRKYGTRRGVAAVGRMIPLGIGAVIGATANYTAIRSLARNADEFFAAPPVLGDRRRLDRCHRTR